VEKEKGGERFAEEVNQRRSEKKKKGEREERKGEGMKWRDVFRKSFIVFFSVLPSFCVHFLRRSRTLRNKKGKMDFSSDVSPCAQAPHPSLLNVKPASGVLRGLLETSKHRRRGFLRNPLETSNRPASGILRNPLETSNRPASGILRNPLEASNHHRRGPEGSFGDG